MLKNTRRKVVKHGQSINLGQFRIEFIKTNHSIQDAAALAIYSPAGIVVHTGDFKVDYTPVFGDAIDLQRFAEIGKKGVLALLSDSTNAERKGFTQSERTVGITFDHIFAEHQNTRIIIATFASNVDRVQQIINSACKYDRKVVVEGRSMVNIIQVAQELGYLNVPENTMIEIDQLKNYPPEKTVLITTGSQGESMAALSRMAADIHKKVTIMPGDTVILSSNPIPGNEKSVSRVINELSEKGANVIFQDAHVSGHDFLFYQAHWNAQHNGTGYEKILRLSIPFHFYGRICPSPKITYFVVVSASNPIGPLACNFCVLIPISAPNPNSNPSVNLVDALT